MPRKKIEQPQQPELLPPDVEVDAGNKVVTLPVRPETELQFIERVLKDPKFDSAKFETLMRWREHERRDHREERFNRAMNLAQLEMKPIAADCLNPQTRSRYPSFAALDRALRPIYGKQGFSISYNTEKDAPENHVRVVAIVRNSEHKEDFHIDIPVVTKGVKGVDMMTLTHATLSATTYGQNKLLRMIFGIAVDKDDDGNAAGAEPITSEQAKELGALLTKVGGAKAEALTKGFLKYFRISALPLLPAAQYENAKAAIEAKQEKSNA